MVFFFRYSYLFFPGLGKRKKGSKKLSFFLVLRLKFYAREGYILQKPLIGQLFSGYFAFFLSIFFGKRPERIYFFFLGYHMADKNRPIGGGSVEILCLLIWVLFLKNIIIWGHEFIL